MKKIFAVLFIVITIWGCDNSTEPSSTTDKNCIESKIFFGLSNGKGQISEAEWQNFLNTEVTTRFPAGFTVIDAQGFWRECDTCATYSEKSKMMLLVYPDTLFSKNILIIKEIANKYIKQFNQQAVLQSSTEVNCSFYTK